MIEISYNLSVKYLSDQMSRDRLLKNSWSYSFGGLTKGVPEGLAATRKDELAVVDVGLAELETGGWVKFSLFLADLFLYLCLHKLD